MAYKNLMLIDDDEDDQEIFITAANEISDSIKCMAFLDASQALEKLIIKEVNPDVIFLDLNMPVMNGQQFLVEIKKNSILKNIPIIIFSTTSRLATINATKELGASDFITKPDKYDQLVKILKPLLI
jgi:CheY-like chemotaxis protein